MTIARRSEFPLLLAGVDEAGRGPLAGPVIAAAVILNPECPIEGLADSKKLTARMREKLFLRIQKDALAWSVGRADANEIDQLNIHHATLLAMKRAIEGLKIKPTQIWVDGKFCPAVEGELRAIVKGDATVQSISAASIIAKVSRDTEMESLNRLYPEYGFLKHKGYPTPLHLEKLRDLGPTPVHRQSVAPVRRLLKNASVLILE